jgi:hypothetical protein
LSDAEFKASAREYAASSKTAGAGLPVWQLCSRPFVFSANCEPAHNLLRGFMKDALQSEEICTVFALV